MKYLILCICWCFLPAVFMAQTNDILYLKSGSVFRGKIIEWQDGKGIKFQNRNGYEQFISEETIKKIVQKPLLTETAHSDKGFKEKGWYSHTSFAALGGQRMFDGGGWQQPVSYKKNVYGLGIANTTGYQFNRWIGVGLGLSYQIIDLTSVQAILPVFVEGRGYFLKTKVAPYYSMNIGYGFAFSQQTGFGKETAKGGLYLHPALGLRFGTGNLKMMMDFGLEVQKATYTQDYSSDSYTNRYTFEQTNRRWVGRLGFIYQ